MMQSIANIWKVSRYRNHILEGLERLLLFPKTQLFFLLVNHLRSQLFDLTHLPLNEWIHRRCPPLPHTPPARGANRTHLRIYLVLKNQWILRIGLNSGMNQLGENQWALRIGHNSGMNQLEVTENSGMNQLGEKLRGESLGEKLSSGPGAPEYSLNSILFSLIFPLFLIIYQIRKVYI